MYLRIEEVGDIVIQGPLSPDAFVLDHSGEDPPRQSRSYRHNIILRTEHPFAYLQPRPPAPAVAFSLRRPAMRCVRDA